MHAVIKYNFIMQDLASDPEFKDLWADLQIAEVRHGEGGGRLEEADDTVGSEVVLKNGKKKVIAGKDEVWKFGRLVTAMVDKNNCRDLLANLATVLGLEDEDSEKKDYRLNAQFKLLKSDYMMTWRMLNSVTKFRCVSGIALINSILKRIELSRKLFKLDMEAQESSLIHGDVKQDDLPQSMRFYDPVIAFAQETPKKVAVSASHSLSERRLLDAMSSKIQLKKKQSQSVNPQDDKRAI